MPSQLEKIGLEAILKDEDFQKGLAAYIRGVDKAVAKTEEGGQQITKSTEKIGGTWQASAKKAGIAMGAMGAAGVALATKVTLTAARTEELGIVLNTVGRNIGKTEDQMKVYEEGVKSMGITTQASRQAIIQMVQANLDLEKSTELARLAQDAAVIAQLDSSEAFKTLITVIQRGSLVMARTLGLTVDFQGAYKELANELGVSVQALTQQQKIQARTNEVLGQSVNIAGTYEAAMESAGKQLRSMSRHIEELENELGSVLLPVMGDIVESTTDFLKLLREVDPVLKSTVVEFGALASVVLLVGGALTTAAPGIIAVIGALGGPVTLAIVAVTALIAGIAALVIHLDNVKTAAQETAAGVLRDADSFEEYEQSMRNAREEARALTEELYNLAKADTAVNLVAFQRAAEELEKVIRSEGDAIQFFESGLASHFGVLGGGYDEYQGVAKGIQEMVKELDTAGLRIITYTDRVYELLIAEGVSSDYARQYADDLRELAAQQLYLNLLLGEGVNNLGGWAGSAREADESTNEMGERYQLLADRAANLRAEIEEITEATGLSADKVRELRVEAGYTADEIEAYAEDLHLTGGELDALAEKTGLSRERLKELNRELGEDDIKDYGKAVAEAAKVTGRSVQEIDAFAKATGKGADELKDFTAEIEDMSEALEDAQEHMDGFFDALLGAMGSVRDADQALKDSKDNFQDTMSDIRTSAETDIDAIRQKYDDMLPDATTAEQRMSDQGDAWDEWAHRALAVVDDVVSGEEAAWEERLRQEAESQGIRQAEGESTYDYMTRLASAFYEGKLPGLIGTETAQYQLAKDEHNRLKDEEVQKATEAANAKLEAERVAFQERQALLREERNQAALLGALQLAEATGELGDFTRSTFPGAMGEMLADADTFFSFYEQGMLDLGDPEIAAALTEFMTNLRFQLGETKGELADNADEAKELWKAGGEGAAAMAEEVENNRQRLVELRQEQERLSGAAATQMGMEGEVDPELQQELNAVNQEIDDLVEEMEGDGPLGPLTEQGEDAVEQVDLLTDSLEAAKELTEDFGEDGKEAIDKITTATTLAKDQTQLWDDVMTPFVEDFLDGLEDIVEEIEDLDGEKIEITVEITTTYNPTVSTAEAISVIHERLEALPAVVPIDVQLTGQAAAIMGAADVGADLGNAIANAVFGNVARYRQPWNAPFWLTNRAAQLGRVGQLYGDIYDEEVLSPLSEELDQINDDLKETERLLEDQAFLRQLSQQQYTDLLANYNAKLEERNRLEDEYNQAQQAQARFDQAKARLDILNTQLQLVKTLYDLDVDPRPILSEIGLGIDASAEDWVDAMAAAMEALALAAEENLKGFLGISSPSQKMIEIGLQMREGLMQGLGMPVPSIVAPQGTSTQTTVNQRYDFSGTVINNGMDQAIFQAMVLQTVRKGMRGY